MTQPKLTVYRATTGYNPGVGVRIQVKLSGPGRYKLVPGVMLRDEHKNYWIVHVVSQGLTEPLDIYQLSLMDYQDHNERGSVGEDELIRRSRLLTAGVELTFSVG